MKFLRKYGEATTITFGLRDTDGVLLKSDAVYVSGDVTISKDEGADNNIDSGFVDEGLGYSMPLTDTEMEAARIQGYIEDQGAPAWLGREFTIETYGHANAQHPNIGLSFALEANVELHVSNAINNTIPLYVREEGTITADNTEQTIYEANPTVIITPDSITLDIGNMVANDRIVIRMYTKLESGGDYKLIDTQAYLDAKTIPTINITGWPNRHGWKTTIEQTAGVLKDFGWESYTLTT